MYPHALEVLFGLNIIRFTVVCIVRNARVFSYLRHFRGFKGQTSSACDVSCSRIQHCELSEDRTLGLLYVPFISSESEQY